MISIDPLLLFLVLIQLLFPSISVKNAGIFLDSQFHQNNHLDQKWCAKALGNHSLNGSFMKFRTNYVDKLKCCSSTLVYHGNIIQTVNKWTLVKSFMSPLWHEFMLLCCKIHTIVSWYNKIANLTNFQFYYQNILIKKITNLTKSGFF